MRLDPEVLDQLRAVGGQELIQILGRTFLEHAPRRLQALRGALEGDDDGELARTLHSLRSAAAVIGARELASLSGALEAAAEAGDRRSVVDGLGDLETGLRELHEMLKRELGDGRDSWPDGPASQAG